MMISDNLKDNHRRIQRCIDQELTPHETRELLFQLDSIPDGWKNLACGLLEDRNFQRAISSSVALRSLPESPVRSARPASSHGSDSLHRPLHEIARRTWAHPLVSLTLCAAIAFVSGLLFPEWTPTKVSTRLAAQARPVISPTDPSRVQSYLVEMQPGQKPLEVPIVTEVGDLQKLGPDHPLFHPSTNEQWMLLPVSRDSLMLLPASKDPTFQMQ